MPTVALKIVASYQESTAHGSINQCNVQFSKIFCKLRLKPIKI